MDEITVKVAPVIRHTNHQTIRPDRVTLGSSADGMDLLRRLHLSGVSVNPMTGTATLSGGGTLMLRINGIEATSAQVTALRPDEIERIEYHDSPGIRYDGADAVIDFITVRRDSGGSLTADAFGAFARGRYASIDHLSARYNSGRSVWSLNTGYMGQRKDRWIRDYAETWRYPDGPVTRRETGLPVTVGGSGAEGTISYCYLHPAGHTLSISLGMLFNDVPNQEEGDRLTLLETSDSDTPVTVREHTEEHSVRPDIGIYYMHTLSPGRHIIVDAGGSYMCSHMTHEYSEGASATISQVEGHRYTCRMLGLMENRSGACQWNIGISANSSSTDNTYTQERPARVRVTQTETALCGEYSNRFGAWGITGNLRLKYGSLTNGSRTLRRFFPAPSFKLSWRPSERWFMRYAASLDSRMPSVAEISDVSQPIQTGMTRAGNPNLHPFTVTAQSLTASYGSAIADVEVKADYLYEHHPVMESVIFGNGTFTRTYLNQRSFRRLRIGAAVTLRPWRDHLSVSAEPTLTRYVSHGRDYLHRHTMLRLGLSVDFTYGHWLAYANIMPGPADSMYGEEITEEKEMNQIMAGYRRGIWSIHLGVFNPFLKDYRMTGRNLSDLAPYTSEAHSGRSSSYVAVKLNLALDFGRQRKQPDIPVSDTADDSDSGILSGSKHGSR